MAVADESLYVSYHTSPVVSSAEELIGLVLPWMSCIYLFIGFLNKVSAEVISLRNNQSLIVEEKAIFKR